MELIVIRHGTTMGNLERRFVGTMDVPLLPEGEELARRVSAGLPPVEHIYRSPLRRCARTAELLWPGVEETVVPELRETDFGPFEGKSRLDLEDDPVYRAWVDRPGGPNFADLPVGEGAAAVAARTAEGLRRMLEDMARRGLGRAAMVSHGGTIMGMLSRFGKPEGDTRDWMCPNCGGFRMAVEPGPVLRRLERIGNQINR